MKQSTRVLVASEYAEARSILRRIVEAEDGGVIVAEAENSTRALSLARNLRPDVALIDVCLPYVVGYDDIPISRAGALDLAQSIAHEIPGARVVLLNRLPGDAVSGGSWRPDLNAFLCMERGEACVPFSIGELESGTGTDGTLFFANVETHATELATPKSKATDSLIFYGVLGAVGGWLMVLTVALAPVGIFAVGAGVLAVLVGLAGKSFSKTARRLHGAPPKR